MSDYLPNIVEEVLDGHEKHEAFIDGDPELAEIYDETQNYAFRRDQAKLVDEVFERSNELLAHK